MSCIKCGKPLPEGALYCPICGAKQQPEARQRHRGNGQGSVYKCGNGWAAEVTLGYYLENGKSKRRIARKKGFRTKKAALEALSQLREPKDQRPQHTLQAVYESWMPTHRAGKSTMDCYKSAWKYYKYLNSMPINDIAIDDLQDALDSCPKGRRTRENMKALMGLLYKYAIPRGWADQNFAQYLVVSGDKGPERIGFDMDQLAEIEKAVGRVPYADYIVVMCYTGFRPSEFLALQISDYDPTEKTLTGGSKTEAGRDRVVTIAPKIQPIIDRLTAKKSGSIFCDDDGKALKLRRFTDECWYPALQMIGIENPVTDGRHKYTPHAARHTFATLLKSVSGADVDKMALIGHSSADMLRYYQAAPIADLRRITDAIGAKRV